MTSSDDDGGPHAITSLVVDSDILSIREIAEHLGKPTPAKKKPLSHWSLDFQADDTSLTNQLAEVERFVAEKIDALAELAPVCEIWLFSTWRPRAGQDHALFSATLVRLLGRVNTDVTLDTWTGCEFCQPGAVDGVEPLIITDGPWAVTSLRIRSDILAMDEIARRIGQRTADPAAENHWCANFESGGGNPLTDELAEVERFLADKIEVLAELAPTCEFDLSARWRPGAGQDHALFSRALVRLLGRTGAGVTLDTWTGCEFCRPDDGPSG